jgi:hypothetical protein
MPVIAVAGAALAIGSAAGSIAAIGTAAFSIADALAVTAAVGATVGAIGVVTGDKGLMTAGMILGGIGGIGSLASSAGLLGDTSASLFGDAAASAASEFPSSVAVTAMNPGLAGATGSLTGDLGSAANAVTATPAIAGTEATPSLAGAAAGDALSSPASSITGNAGVASQLPTQAPVAPISLTPNAALTPPAPTAPTSFSQSLTQAGAGTVPIAPSVSSPGILDTLGDFVRNDKSGMVSYGLIQAGGSLIGGLFDPLKPAQVSQLNAQTAQTNAQTDITKTQAANIKQPLPIAQSGLINSYGAVQ